MDELFYSPKEKIVFWVTLGSSEKVQEIISSLKRDAAKFAAFTKVASDAVHTMDVKESRQYKNKRVFYAQADTAPQGAFIISETSTMHTWLEY